MTIRNLDRLLEPRSVAVFGASDRPASVGTTVWRNLRAGRFGGPVYAVNPKRSVLDGERVFARAADLPCVPDLAVLCTPPATVPGLVAELGALGTRAAVLMSAGLTAAQKQAALDAARPHLLRLLGPNCIGLMTPRLGLNATFAHTDALPGEIAFVSQSGALVTAMLDWAKSRRIGFSHLVSLGERIDADFGDLLDMFANDAPDARGAAVHRVGRGTAQVHVGGARGRTQQTGDRRQGRSRRPRRERGSFAHRGAGRIGHRVRRRDPARRHAARGHARRPVPRRADLGALPWQHQRRADDHDQRRRQRRDGGRRGRSRRRAARHARRRPAAHARRRVAGDLVARQPDRPDRRCAGRALHDDAVGPAREARKRRSAVPARPDRDRAQRRHRTRLRAARACNAEPGDELLARRRRGGAGARHLRRRRRARLRDAGRSGARVRDAAHLSAQPAIAARGACRARKRRARPWRRTFDHRARAVRGPRMAERGRGEGAARGLSDTGRAGARDSGRPGRRGGRRARDRLPGGPEDRVARHHAQVRRGRRAARSARRRRRARRRSLDARARARAPARRAARRLQRAADDPAAERARADRRGQHRCGVRPGAAVRPRRHRGRGRRRPRGRAAAAEPPACGRADLTHAGVAVAGRLSRPRAGAAGRRARRADCGVADARRAAASWPSWTSTRCGPTSTACSRSTRACG